LELSSTPHKGRRRKIECGGKKIILSGKKKRCAGEKKVFAFARHTMKRDGIIPLSNFDLAELKEDVFTDIELSTAANSTSTLKMTSTLGEFFAKKFYLYTKQTNKVLRPI
jgi:hypothetical protein